MGRRAQWLLLAGLLVHDFGAFAVHAQVTKVPFENTLSHWDSNWYADLVEAGRDATPASQSRWAFLPLLIGLVRALCEATSLSPAVVGAMVSTGALMLSMWLLTRSAEDAVSSWGWFFFLWSPASYALHTLHTESLFLLFSVVAWQGTRRGQLLLTSLALAAALWTRNQGVLLAGVLVVSWYRKWGIRRAGVLALACVTAQLGLFGFAAHEAGDPWAFQHAQQHWEHVGSLGAALSTLIMGNEAAAAPWVMRQLFAYGWLAMIVVHVRRRQVQAGAYAAASFVPMLLQGQFHNVFRFSAVMFPTLFELGNTMARAPRWVRYPAAGLWVSLHHVVLLAWLKDAWAY